MAHPAGPSVALDPRAGTDWDRYAAAHPEGTPFLADAWGRVVESSYGVERFFLAAREGDEWRGILPLFLFRSALFGKRLMTAPFASWGSVCASDPGAEQALLERAIGLARETAVGYLELRGPRPHGHPSLRPSRTPWANYVLPLRDPDELWSKVLKGRARTAVRKARKSDVRIERGHHLLDPFYEIMAISMRRLGTPVHAKRFYRNILSCLGEQAELLAAYSGDTAIAVYLLVRDDRRMFHWTAGSRPGFEKLNANSLLMWSSLELACASGTGLFDFGRSPAGSGTARFKEQWGADRVDLHYEYFLHRSRAVPDVTPANPRYRLAVALWQRLPLALTRLLGPFVMRSIP